MWVCCFQVVCKQLWILQYWRGAEVKLHKTVLHTHKCGYSVDLHKGVMILVPYFHLQKWYIYVCCFHCFCTLGWCSNWPVHHKIFHKTIHWKVIHHFPPFFLYLTDPSLASVSMEKNYRYVNNAFEAPVGVSISPCLTPLWKFDRKQGNLEHAWKSQSKLSGSLIQLLSFLAEVWRYWVAWLCAGTHRDSDRIGAPGIRQDVKLVTF